jgi:hypothetical protein
MAEKKEASAQKATKKKAARGESYVCEVCGLAVIVDEVCGCVETHEIICCGKPMKEKTAKAKAAKK